MGAVCLDPTEHDDDDLTLIDVPVECVGYVTGRSSIFVLSTLCKGTKGATMRKIEEVGFHTFFLLSKPGMGYTHVFRK